jgi:spore germination cell wall hydrolase CwlJ-like protein
LKKIIVLCLWAVLTGSLCYGINYYYKQRAEQREKEFAEQYKEIRYIADDGKVSARIVNQKELTCLAENIYHEAAGETLAGKMAVGLVTLNRVRSGRFAKTVCGVVNQRVGGSCQFSWRCEPGLVTRNNQQWRDSWNIATYLMTNTAYDITAGATYFHNQSVKPNWKNLNKTGKIDNHTFYSRPKEKKQPMSGPIRLQSS